MTPLDIESIERRERPIIMTAESVRAILEGRKSQTRRVVKPPKDFEWPIENGEPVMAADGSGDVKFGTRTFGGAIMARTPWIPCPYGAVGDRLWLREIWGYRGSSFSFGANATYRIEYRADLEGREFEFPYTIGATNNDPPGLPRQRSEQDGEDEYEFNDYLREYWAAWRSPIHMPRWASRLTLEITAVRVERLQDISEVDAIFEGVEPVINESQEDDWEKTDFVAGYQKLWDSLNEKRGYGWESNPFVWVVEFKRVEISVAAVSGVGDTT